MCDLLNYNRFNECEIAVNSYSRSGGQPPDQSKYPTLYRPFTYSDLFATPRPPSPFVVDPTFFLEFKDTPAA